MKTGILDVKNDTFQLSATYRWFFMSRFTRALISCILCFSIVILYYWILGDEFIAELTIRPISENDVITYISIAGFFIFILVVGAWSAYQLLRIGLNTTTVNLTRDELTVSHRPLPPRGNRAIKCYDISKFSIEEGKESWLIPVPTADAPGSGIIDFNNKMFRLKVELRNGKSIILLSDPDHFIIHRLQDEIVNFLSQ